MAPTKQIISASRRTDIPHYFARWFEKRLRDGRAEFRNSFGGKGEVSLKPEDVAGFVFWTKHAKPFHGILETLRADQRPYAFHYTITGIGGSAVEPNIPKTDQAIDDFLRVREGLPDSRAIQWRYDPIVLTDELNESYHVKKFSMIAERLRGATRVVNVSFIEPYVKSIRRLREHETTSFRQVDPERHKTTARKKDQIRQVTVQRGGGLLRELSACAAEHGMQLRSCCNPEFGIPASQCIGKELFAAYGHGLVDHLQEAPSRPSCRCLKVADIGMDNTCVGGCKYCYVVVSQKVALRNFKAHDPAAKMMRVPVTPGLAARDRQA